MTDPIVTIDPALVTVQPGGQARVVVTILNPGIIIEGYDVEVVDEVAGTGGLSGPAEWAQVLVADAPGRSTPGRGSVSVDVQQRAEVVIVFSPPTGPTVPSGQLAFGVKVQSTVDKSTSVVVEGDIDVGRVFGLQAKIVPMTSAGRWSGNHTLQISNWGNAPARLRLMASDRDQALAFLVRPDVVDVPLGANVVSRVKVRTRRPRLRGQPAMLPFSIVAEPDGSRQAGPTPVTTDPGRPVIDGAFTQKPILSRAVVTAGALALVAAAALGGIAFARQPQAPILPPASGLPDTPKIGKVRVLGAETIEISWTPVSDITGYTLLQLDGKTNDVTDEKPLGKQLSAQTITDLLPNTRYCFSLIAVRGDISTPASDPTCATTQREAVTSPTTSPPDTSTSPPTSTTPDTSTSPPTSTTPDTSTSPPTSTTPDSPTSSTSPTTVVQFGPNDWVREVEVRFSKVEADVRASELAGIGAKVLFTGDYPNSQPRFVTPSWIIYVGPFGSQPEACAYELKAGPTQACLAIRPSPPR